MDFKEIEKLTDYIEGCLKSESYEVTDIDYIIDGNPDAYSWDIYKLPKTMSYEEFSKKYNKEKIYHMYGGSGSHDFTIFMKDHSVFTYQEYDGWESLKFIPSAEKVRKCIEK